jgi:hypothetical protein
MFVSNIFKFKVFKYIYKMSIQTLNNTEVEEYSSISEYLFNKHNKEGVRLNLNVEKELTKIRKEADGMERKLNQLYMRMSILEEKDMPKNFTVCFINDDYVQEKVEDKKESKKNNTEDGFITVKNKRDARKEKKKLNR